jgi:hypothetical protein
MADPSIEKICIVDLSQPSYAAPLDRVCTVELQPRVSGDRAIDAMYLVVIVCVVGFAIGFVAWPVVQLIRASRRERA